MIDASAEWSDVPDDTPERLDDHESSRLGRYVLCRRLADGGMGSVYLAKAEGPGGFERAFAIKRIHPHLARRKDLVEMFLDEARLSARIHHPNVCSTVDFGEAEGTWFLAMEYLLGESFASLVRTVAEVPDLLASERWQAIAARIVADAAEGLHAAHELSDEHGATLGVVHRDVSPQNLFVTYDGGVKVLDFGVARAEGRIHQTRSGALKGKVAYMAPEQLASRPVDRRADVFALGVCLWEALTGKRLFKRETDFETIQNVGTLAIVPPSRLVPGIAPALDACVLAALERDPDARTPSARALAAALEEYLHRRATATTRADVAALMSERFSGRKATKREIVRTELAGAEERSGVVLVPVGRDATASLALDEATPSLMRARVGEATPSFVPAPAASPPVIVEARPVESVERALDPELPPRRVPWIALTLIGLATCAGVGLLLVVGARDPRPVPATVLPATPPPEARVVEAPEPRPVEPVEGPADLDLSELDVPVAQAPRRRSRRVTPIEPAPSPPVDARPGRVNVVTRGGWADVYLQGRLLGRTPRSVELPAGDHELELRAFGRAPGRTVRVHVEPGAVERVVEQVSQ